MQTEIQSDTPQPDSSRPSAWVFPHAAPILRDGRTLVMGIVNMTPDSFSGQNAARDEGDALRMATRMIEDGADILDLGAESSRPGAVTLTWREEAARLGNVIKLLRRETTRPISVDTYHPETARMALDHGADIINDITALRAGWGAADREDGDAELASDIARSGAHVVLMHMPSSPAEMQTSPEYGNVVAEVRDFLLRRAEFAATAGIPPERVWLDPGFGFGKNFRHNRDLLVGLPGLAGTGYPVLAGLSRKRMIADALGEAAGDRVAASLALAVIASQSGADAVRVHDVAGTVRAVRMADAIRLARSAGEK